MSSKRIRSKNGSKPYWEMSTAELGRATAEFEREFVVDKFGAPTTTAKARMTRSNKKRGRPTVGKGVKVISVSLEKGLLMKADKLAKRLRVSRARLISRGLEAMLNS
jgi:hypothetical protein